MNANTSLKSFELSLEFIKDKDKAKEFVAKIEESIDGKFEDNAKNFATKSDIAESENRLSKTIYIVCLVQFLAIIASVLAIVNFMLK